MARAAMESMATQILAGEITLTIDTPPLAMCSYWLTLRSLGACANKKPPAQSSTEAEYMGLAEAGNQSHVIPNVPGGAQI